MAVPRLCVCSTSRGSGPSLARAQSRLSQGTTAPALFRGHSEGKPGLVGAVGGVRMPLFTPCLVCVFPRAPQVIRLESLLLGRAGDKVALSLPPGLSVGIGKK